MIYLKYLKSLLLHKWFVFLAGLKTGVPVWRLIVHDWSKFMPIEFINYAKWHGGIKNKSVWVSAWGHHQNFNPHHPEYWIINWRGDPAFYDDIGIKINDFTVITPMPKTYIKEMVADMMGASRAYTGSWDMTKWLDSNMGKIRAMMHPDSFGYFETLCKQ